MTPKSETHWYSEKEWEEYNRKNAKETGDKLFVFACIVLVVVTAVLLALVKLG